VLFDEYLIVHSKCMNYVTLAESCVTLISLNELTFRRKSGRKNPHINLYTIKNTL